MSRAIFEMRAHAESLGLSLKIWRRHQWDVAEDEPDKIGWYAQEIGFSQNPLPGTPEIFLGRTPEAARAALTAMKESA